MSFLNPEYFWLLILLVPVFIKRDSYKLNMTVYLYMFSFLFILIALCRPVIEQEPIKSEEVLSDVIIAVDLSYSMQADDIKPKRLTKAKELLSSLVKKDVKSRYGVLGFTTNAIVLSPLTQDSELLLHLFNALDEKLIITKGSSIFPALKLARKMSYSNTPSVVILSDGTDEVDYEEELKFAKDNGLVVNVLMLATSMGGTIKLEDGELLKDAHGDIVVSRENEEIAMLTDGTGGVYTKDIDEIRSALDSQKDEDIKTQTTIVRNLELFYYFVAMAIVTFLIAVTTLKRFIAVILLFLGISSEASVLEYIYELQGKSAYEKQEYEKAVEYYKNIDNAKAYFNLACSYYKKGEYEKALSSFERVLSDDEQFKSEVFYNMANTLVRLKKFKKARDSYLKSLTLTYSKAADENLAHIKGVKEPKSMTSGKQKSKKKSSTAKKEQGGKKKKEGGGSNMQVSAAASSGAGDMGKKTKAEAQIDLNGAKAKLSSRQYELINKRGVNEKKPW